MEWPERLDAMVGGYRNSMILVSALKVGLFEAFGHGERTAEDIAAELELDLRATDTVVRALAAAKVLIRTGDRFAIEPELAPLLLRESPQTRASIIGHNLSMMKSWLDLPDVLRLGGGRKQHQERSPEQLRDYILGMENVSRLSSEEVADKIDLSGVRHLLDLGGGPATASITFARRHPGLRCTVFDLPPTLEIAREQILAAGLQDRIDTLAGDFHGDPLLADPAGHVPGAGPYDVVYISNIIHMLPAEQTLQLFRKAQEVLTPDGRLLVKDFFLEDCRTTPAMGAQFSVNMLMMTEGGKTYTLSETLDLLGRSGFGRFQVCEVATVSQVITGFRES